jgi:hypothetical protein
MIRTDLMIFNFADGKDCTFDVSVINPASASCIADASVTQKSSIDKANTPKIVNTWLIANA